MLESTKVYLATCDRYIHLVERWQYLFNKFWGDGEQEVVVLGYKEPKFTLDSNVRFVSLGAEDRGPKMWATDLGNFFRKIEDEYFYFWLEDQILIDYSNLSLLRRSIEDCMADESFGRFGLSAGISRRKHCAVKQYDDFSLIRLEQTADYRIAVQPSLWSRSYFLKYLEDGYSPWDFEVKGSRRAKGDGFNIYSTGDKFVIDHVQSVVRGDLTSINLGTMSHKMRKELNDQSLIHADEQVSFEEPSYSQYLQDIFLRREFFSELNEGVFVEVGADDGVDKSNTLLYEQIGWTGICVEPSPSRFKKLIENRQCQCVNKAIHRDRANRKFIDINGYGKGLSGIVDNYDSRHRERIARETEGNDATHSVEEVEVECVPLSELFEQAKLTRVDFISIDVEGGELDVLKSIDFEKVTVGVLLIEENYRNIELRDLLKSKGFHLLGRLKIDQIYVNESVYGDRLSFIQKLTFKWACLRHNMKLMRRR